MLQVSWANVKTFISDRGARLQYVDLGTAYYVAAFDGTFALHTMVYKSTTEGTDFENNYKNNAETNASAASEGFVDTFVRTKRAFTCTTDLTTVSSQNETALLYLKNPSGSGKRIRITHIKGGTDSSNVRTILRFRFNPTISANGTALDIASTYIETTQSTSSMEAYKLPTDTDLGGLLNIDISPADSPSKGTNRTYYIEPGHTFLVTVENSSSNAKTFADIYWLEGV